MSIQAINVRNQFKGKVKEIIRGDVVSEVDVETPWGIVTSVITTRSVDELQLKPGSDVVALVKSTEVSIARRPELGAARGRGRNRPRPTQGFCPVPHTGFIAAMGGALTGSQHANTGEHGQEHRRSRGAGAPDAAALGHAALKFFSFQTKVHRSVDRDALTALRPEWARP